MTRHVIAYVPFHDARKWAREGLRTRDGHVARELVRGMGTDALLVVNRPTCLAELVKLRGAWKTPGPVIQRVGLRSIARGPTGAPAADQLVPQLGFRGGSFHRWLMYAYGTPAFGSHVRHALADTGSAPDGVLWLCHPFAAALASGWSGRVVLDAFDNFAVHPHIPADVRADVHAAYGSLANKAERIAVNSQATQAYLKEHFGRDSLVVPNAVDPTLFENAAPMKLSVPSPIIGYAGKLGTRIDVELLTKLGDAVTSGTIVIAGQTLNAEWMRPARNHPRIHFLGDLHYRTLPSFLAACAVCIVAHRVGAGENHGDATKIYEYLAAGKPVVTTAIGGTGRFAGRVAIASSHADFIEATIAAANGQPVPRGGLKPDETWSARTAELCRYFGVATSALTSDAGSSTASATPRRSQ